MISVYVTCTSIGRPVTCHLTPFVRFKGRLRCSFLTLKSLFQSYSQKGAFLYRGISPLKHNDDVIKWKLLTRYWSFVQGIHRSPMNSLHKSQWRGALMFSLICALNKRLSNNREASDLRRHRFHYDVIVMQESKHVQHPRQHWLLKKKRSKLHLQQEYCQFCKHL